jgi:hypothetical protein
VETFLYSSVTKDGFKIAVGGLCPDGMGNECAESYKALDTNIFRSVHNVNLNTLIGYRKNDIYHNFLDDYDVRKNNNTGANV